MTRMPAACAMRAEIGDRDTRHAVDCVQAVQLERVDDEVEAVRSVPAGRPHFAGFAMVAASAIVVSRNLLQARARFSRRVVVEVRLVQVVGVLLNVLGKAKRVVAGRVPRARAGVACFEGLDDVSCDRGFDRSMRSFLDDGPLRRIIRMWGEQVLRERDQHACWPLMPDDGLVELDVGLPNIRRGGRATHRPQRSRTSGAATQFPQFPRRWHAR